MDHEDPDAIAWAKLHAGERIETGPSGETLSNEQRRKLRATIVNGLEKHQTTEQIAQALQTSYAFSEQRADLIANTEVRNAREQGAYRGAIRAFKTQPAEKKWLLSNDEGVCPICEANAAQGWIPIKKRFSSGDQAPLAHPRCRCVGAFRRIPKEG